MEDKIDRAYEAEGNALDEVGRAEFRRGVMWAISVIRAYKADKKNYSHTNNPVINAAIRTTCSNLETDLSE